MSQTIWKFPLPFADVAKITMPRSAQVLCVQMQRGRPCIWALVHDVGAEAGERIFRTYGTGHQHETISGVYIGTYPLEGGALVFHVFEDR